MEGGKSASCLAYWELSGHLSSFPLSLAFITMEVESPSAMKPSQASWAECLNIAVPHFSDVFASSKLKSPRTNEGVKHLHCFTNNEEFFLQLIFVLQGIVWLELSNA